MINAYNTPPQRRAVVKHKTARRFLFFNNQSDKLCGHLKIWFYTKNFKIELNSATKIHLFE